MSLSQLGGGMGVAACIIGMAISVTLCAGLGGVLILSIVPMLLSVAGLSLAIIGPNVQKHPLQNDAGVFAAIFVNLLGIVGSAVLIWMWMS